MSVRLLDMYVDIQADGRGAARDAARDFEATGSPSFMSSGLSFGKRMVGGLALAAGGAVVGAVGTLAGVALTKGLDRALSIQDATAKLTGLGHTGEGVREIMDNALASVRGTAFGLGDAAGVAAGAVAAGIAPGEKLTRVLKLTADAATIAGVGMNEMGSIFNKVAASGKLQGDVIAQLQDAGVPVLQFVAKQMGVTAAEAANLASEGKVSFETFADAMEQGLGGAALASGATARGAFANIGAALGRFGAMFTTPLVAAAPAFFTSLTGVIDVASEAAKPFAAAFGTYVTARLASASEAITGATEKFKGMGEALRGLRDLIFSGDFTGALTTAFGWQEDSPAVDRILDIRDALVAFKEQLQPVADAFAPLVGQVVDLWTSFSPLSLIFQALAPYLPQLATGFGSLVAVIGTSLGNALTTLLPVLQETARALASELADAVMDNLPALQELGEQLLELAVTVLPQLLPLLTDLIVAVLPLLPVVLELILAALPPVIDLLSLLLTPTGNTDGITGTATALTAIVTAVSAALKFLPGGLVIIGSLIDLLSGDITPSDFVQQVLDGKLGTWFQGFGEQLLAAFTTLDQAKTVVSGALADMGETISQKFEEIVAWFQGLPQRAVDGLAALGQMLMAAGQAALVGMFNGVVFGAVFLWTFFTNLPGVILSHLIDAGTWLLATGQSAMTGLGNGLVAGYVAVSAWFQALPANILALVATAGSWLLMTGQNVLNGMWNGMVTGYTTVSAFVTSIPGRITGALASAASWLLGTGRNATEGLASGASQGFGRVASFFSSMPSRIIGALGDVGGLLVSAGSQVVNGFVNGMSSGIQRVAAKAAEVANAARLAAERALGIASPSRVFRDKVGKQVGAGFIIGVDSMADKMQMSMAAAVTPRMTLSQAVPSGVALAPSLRDAQPAQTIVHQSITVPVTESPNATLYGRTAARAIADELVF
jgi:tape measure domain-containing protein